MMWDDVTKAGTVVVSDEIKFEAAIQLVKQAKTEGNKKFVNEVEERRR